jgi:hypothetical protein
MANLKRYPNVGELIKHEMDTEFGIVVIEHDIDGLMVNLADDVSNKKHFISREDYYKSYHTKDYKI